jgi:hypothetical protein
MKINIHNYEAYFLSYIDNELSAAGIKEVNLFLKEYPNYSTELALLKQAILMPEEIVYEDKALLYRHQEMEASLPLAFKEGLYRQEAPVLKGFFNQKGMRSFTAIAALLLLFIGYQWFFQSGNSNPTFTPENTLASATKTEFSNNGSGSKKLIQQGSIETNKSSQDKLSVSNILNQPTNEVTEASQQQYYAALEDNRKLLIAENNTRNTLVETGKTHLIAPSTSHIAPIVNNTIAMPTEDATTEVAVSYEEYNTDNADRGIYIANLEIDGEKLRGLGRRFNALLRKNKNR